MSSYDFSGWATRNDIECADGLTIRQDAFADCDGIDVPLVYMHDHKDVENVLGHCTLENRADGVYCYGAFNDTEKGQMAKALVAHGDITSLSIFANQLVKRGKDVLHGAIREVSLVLAGANPGATIDFPVLQHSDGSYEDIEDEAIISFKQPFSISDELAHFLDEDEDDYLEQDDMDEDEAEEEDDDDEPTVEEVMESLDEDQQALMEGMMQLAYEKGVADASGESEEDDSEEADEEDTVEQSAIGGNEMRKNVFEKDSQDTVLQHGMDAADASAILNEAKSGSQSLKATSLAHGITDIDWLFLELPLEFAAASSAGPAFCHHFGRTSA